MSELLVLALLSKNIFSKKSMPSKIIINGQSCAYAGGHGVQAAIGRIVGVSLRIRRTIQLPVLVRELVIGVVVLAGAKDASVSFLLLAVK